MFDAGLVVDAQNGFFQPVQIAYWKLVIVIDFNLNHGYYTV